MRGLRRNLGRLLKRVRRAPAARRSEPPAHGDEPDVRFVCNICAAETTARHSLLRDREQPSCPSCGSNLRYRTIVAGLSRALFDDVMPIAEFPLRRDIRGIGLSDCETYAARLPDRLHYTNTFFHKPPRLDVMNVEDDAYRDLDFVISSDVFEHVAPPVDRAFTNARGMLRKGGAFVFSVPFVPGETREHYPNLHEYRVQDCAGTLTLFNRTRAGADESFTNLVFHGGPGTTLEMRLFGLETLRRTFVTSGFAEPVLLDAHLPQFGIDWRGEHCSIPLVAIAV